MQRRKAADDNDNDSGSLFLYFCLSTSDFCFFPCFDSRHLFGDFFARLERLPRMGDFVDGLGVCLRLAVLALLVSLL